MQPIIGDSEDEDEEEFLVQEEEPVVSKPSQQSNHSWMNATVDEILADNPPSQRSEGADQSSLSTGEQFLVDVINAIADVLQVIYNDK